MTIYTFGAYFGLAAALVLYNRRLPETRNEGSNYVSDIFSLVGARAAASMLAFRIGYGTVQ